MTNNSTYNGWTNSETWQVQLEMVNGKTLEDFGRVLEDVETVAGVVELAYAVQDACAEIITTNTEEGLGRDYALAFLRRVKWYEIAKHMVEDAETRTTR
jgi:hypothetical protein